jgi:ribonuclease P protein component
MDIFLAESSTTEPRAGVLVPRYGRTIVERNRLRRRLREIVRIRWLPSEARRAAPRELLVRARREAYGCTFLELQEGFEQAMEAGS